MSRLCLLVIWFLRAATVDWGSMSLQLRRELDEESADGSNASVGRLDRLESLMARGSLSALPSALDDYVADNIAAICKPDCGHANGTLAALRATIGLPATTVSYTGGECTPFCIHAMRGCMRVKRELSWVKNGNNKSIFAYALCEFARASSYGQAGYKQDTGQYLGVQYELSNSGTFDQGITTCQTKGGWMPKDYARQVAEKIFELCKTKNNQNSGSGCWTGLKFDTATSVMKWGLDDTTLHADRWNPVPEGQNSNWPSDSELCLVTHTMNTATSDKVMKDSCTATKAVICAMPR